MSSGKVATTAPSATSFPSHGKRSPGGFSVPGDPGHRVCAWCGKHLGVKAGLGGRTTHGICETCRDRVLAEYHMQSAKEESK